MKLRYDSSFKRDRIEFTATPGLEIEVPDELGEELARRYARFQIVGAKKASPAEQPEEAPAAPTTRKTTRRKSTRARASRT